LPIDGTPDTFSAPMIMILNSTRRMPFWLKILQTCSLIMASATHAQTADMVWNLEAIVRSKDDPVVLRNSGGTVVRRLDATIPRYIYVVAQDIVHSAETPADFFITTGKAPNAAAGKTRGKNTVLINLGMIDMVGTDMSQWAALLGHEIAHLTLDHHGEQADRLGPRVLLQVITYGALPDPNLRQLADMAFQAYETSYGRDAERESDYLGVIWAVESGYDPMGAVRLHENFQRRSGGHPVPFLSTHPSSAERISTLRRLANNLGDK
jgi:predicted Zn-dependent protease